MRTWILAVVHNRGIDLLRTLASRRRTREEAEAEAPRSQPSEAFAETWGIYRRDRVREALRDLPRDQREVLALVHFSGLTQTEVCERLHLPLGTVGGACGSGYGSCAITPRSGRWRSGSRSVDGPGSLFTRVRGRRIPPTSGVGLFPELRAQAVLRTSDVWISRQHVRPRSYTGRISCIRTGDS